MTEKLDITLTINGRDYPIRVEPRRTLVDAIRDDCGQTGTHIGCEHGICGACTIILEDDAVRACLMFAVQANGKKIRTVEGLATGDVLHPIQQAFIDNHGLQCGFCTPGMIMAAIGIVDRKGHDLDEHTVREQLYGNFCRCTGYHNIVRAVLAAAETMSA
jgi:carbon-monoxide dehydrogenase small subunit